MSHLLFFICPLKCFFILHEQLACMIVNCNSLKYEMRYFSKYYSRDTRKWWSKALVAYPAWNTNADFINNYGAYTKKKHGNMKLKCKSSSGTVKQESVPVNLFNS